MLAISSTNLSGIGRLDVILACQFLLTYFPQSDGTEVITLRILIQ